MVIICMELHASITHLTPIISLSYLLIRWMLVNGIESFTSTTCTETDEFIILAGDFNMLDCHQLENQYGLVQLVN